MSKRFARGPAFPCCRPRSRAGLAFRRFAAICFSVAIWRSFSRNCSLAANGGPDACVRLRRLVAFSKGSTWSFGKKDRFRSARSRRCSEFFSISSIRVKSIRRVQNALESASQRSGFNPIRQCGVPFGLALRQQLCNCFARNVDLELDLVDHAASRALRIFQKCYFSPGRGGVFHRWRMPSIPRLSVPESSPPPPLQPLIGTHELFARKVLFSPNSPRLFMSINYG
jgi:hypothetical protein